MHGLKEHDKQQGRKQAWHKLTDVKENLEIKNCWLSEWDVNEKQFKMEVMHGLKGKGVLTIDSPYSYLTASDNESIIIGKPFMKSYVPLTNARLLEICERAIAESKGAFLESCGTINNRNRVFLSFALSELKKFKGAGRVFEPYLNFGNSFDGSCPVWVNTSNICTVCNNTFNANLMSKSSKVIQLRVKHTKNSEGKIENMVEIIEAAIHTQDVFAKRLDEMADKSVKENDARAFIAYYIAGDTVDVNSKDEEDHYISTRSNSIIERVLDLFKNGAGNKGENLADLFSAFTDYYSHESSGGDSVLKQFQASEFGVAGLKKQEIFETLINNEKTKESIKKGIAVLALQG